MMFVLVPPRIRFSEMFIKSSLSPHDYRKLQFRNKNVKRMQDLLCEDYLKGVEIGSGAYLDNSCKYFIRTKALQPDFYLPILDDKECAVPMLPQKFKNLGLQKGDILLSKDANIGECAILTKDLPDYMISGGIVKLRFLPDYRYYVFAIMKHSFFKDQINLRASKGATIKHAKDLWLDALIPFPTQRNKDEVIEYVSLLTKAIMRKEEEIKRKFYEAMRAIRNELTNNQKPFSFIYNFPKYSEVSQVSRLDTGIYNEVFKREMFLIKNYINGYKKLTDLDFDIQRGQNLQVSAIGESIYSEKRNRKYYKLILPTNITRYGTVSKFLWLGNKRVLSTLNNGDLILGAEATLRSYVYIKGEMNNEKAITNIHGIVFSNNKKPLSHKIFLKIFLDYLREKKILGEIMTGGHGGSLAIKYIGYVLIPIFPHNVINSISKLYYNPALYNPSKLNIDNFEKEDIKITQQSGIYNLDLQIKAIKDKLDEIITAIVMDKEVIIDFAFLNKVF